MILVEKDGFLLVREDWEGDDPNFCIEELQPKPTCLSENDLQVDYPIEEVA